MIMVEIMEKALKLNRKKGVDVFLCLQGNTGCLNLTVEENKSVSYTNKVFATDESGLDEINKDLNIMLGVGA